MYTLKICIPFYSNISQECKTSLQKLPKEKDGIQIIFDNTSKIQNSVIHTSRNFLISEGNQKKNQHVKFDYYLCLDSDIYDFTFDDIKSMIILNESIVSGMYKTHLSSYNFQVGYFRKDCEGWVDKRLTLSDFGKGKTEVDFCGSGFLLLRRDFLENVHYPWFRPIVIEFGEYAECPSDDIGLCIHARKSGYKIFCDSNVIVKHKLRKPSDFKW